MSKILIAIYVIATSAALVILKLGAKSGAPVSFMDNKLQFNINAYTLSGVALYGLSFLTYVYLISRYDLGYIVPITTAFVYIAIFTASYFVFKESFTALKVAGIALIIVGLAFLNIKK